MVFEEDWGCSVAQQTILEERVGDIVENLEMIE
jgi:hypothetical protein